ncbi:MAG: tetratricopeptide repeat protein, partial [Proteobacteria bacterium]|nr:tetratricopeptide repeat protein [Pseudomonadota bacterium]
MADSGEIAIAGACCEICKRVFMAGVLGGECPNCLSKLPKSPDWEVSSRFCIDCLGGSPESLIAGRLTCPQCGARLMNSVLPYDEEAIEETLKDINKKGFRNKEVRIKPDGKIELVDKDVYKPNVIKQEDKGDVNGLIKALEYEEDQKVRKKAAEALKGIGDGRAIEDYNKSIELDPNYADAYNNRGIAYRNLKEYERA